MAHDVFISYTARDKRVAEAVCEVLESRYIRCWIAPRDILPGTEWAEATVDALDASRIFVLVLSSSSNNSPQVIREVGRAASKDIPIIPLRIDDVPPSKSIEFFISSHHWLDAYTPPLEKHLQRLADAVQMLLTSKYGAQFQPALVEETEARKQVAEKRSERVGEKKRLPVTVEKPAEKRKVLAKSVWFWAGIALLCTGLGLLVLYVMKWFCFPVIILGVYCLRRGWAEGRPPKPAVVRVKPLSQVEKPTEARRVLVPTAQPLPVAKKEHPVWFWVGLFLFVPLLSWMIGLFIVLAGSAGKANIPPGMVLAWNLPFIIPGIILIRLSKRKINHHWFWVGSIIFACGLASVPAWLFVWKEYSTHDGFGPPWDLVAGFLFVIFGAFCLWKGWPRTGVKHPRGEVSGFLTAICLIWLASSLLSLAGPGEKGILSFSDNFEDGVANGWSLDPGWVVTLDSGNHVLEGQGQGWARPQVTEATAYTLDADFKLLGGKLNFNTMLSQDSKNRYAVVVSQGYLGLSKDFNEQSLPLDGCEANIALGQWYHIKIVVGGNITAVYLDGELKMEYWDENPLSSGSFAIETCENSHAFVGNIVVGPNTYSTPQLLHILSFSDNFEDGVANGWNLDTGWAVTLNGTNHVLSFESQNYQWARPRVTQGSNYTVEADFMLLSGEFEIDVRLSSTERYIVWIQNNTVTLGKETNNKAVELSSAYGDIGLNQWYKAEIAIKGSNIQVFIDDNLKIDYLDKDPIYQGSFAFLGNPNSHVWLDNIAVWPN